MTDIQMTGIKITLPATLRVHHKDKVARIELCTRKSFTTYYNKLRSQTDFLTQAPKSNLRFSPSFFHTA